MVARANSWTISSRSLTGPPGTGTTMAAGLVAMEPGLDLYSIDLSRMASKYIGETEKNLAHLFDAAETGHAILLFDEADSLFSRENDPGGCRLARRGDRVRTTKSTYPSRRTASRPSAPDLQANGSPAREEASKLGVAESAVPTQVVQRNESW